MHLPPATVSAAPQVETTRPLGSLRGRVMGVRLAWKIIVANGIVLLGALAIWGRLVAGSGWNPMPLAITAAGVLAASALFNAALVRVALQPISDLEATAERVRDGDMAARTPPSPLADPGVDRLRIVFNDMLDQVVRLSEAQRRRSRTVLQAEERDRGQISDGLFGDTAQTLAAVLVQLRLLERAVERGEDPTVTSHYVTRNIRTALNDVREVARRLRPPELDDLGVQKAIETFGRRLVEEGPTRGAELRIEGEVPEDQLDELSRIALFRIVQEALRNAVEHAHAACIRIEFSTADDQLRVAVLDDGRGFDSAALFRNGSPGLGVLAMTERAQLTNGTLSIDSGEVGGSRVSLTLPLSTPSRPRPTHSIGDL